jgi:hypothetical protein
VPTALDDLSVDLLGQVLGQLLGGGVATRRSEELHFYEVPIVQLVCQFVDHRFETALAYPHSHIEFVNLSL